jgi:protein SCO1/2
MSALKLVRYGAWAVVAGVAVAAIALSLGWFHRSDAPTTNVVTVGGPFALVDTEGKPVTEAAFAGTPRAMFFGFTNCPDVCPTTLYEATGWLKSLGPDADKLKVIFVTVDPERDTPEAMKSYLSSFDPRIVGLTGTPEEVAKVIKAFRVYARKVETEGGDYTMDHSAAVLLFDGNGRFVGTVDYQEPADRAVAKLKGLVGAG